MGSAGTKSGFHCVTCNLLCVACQPVACCLQPFACLRDPQIPILKYSDCILSLLLPEVRSYAVCTAMSLETMNANAVQYFSIKYLELSGIAAVQHDSHESKHAKRGDPIYTCSLLQLQLAACMLPVACSLQLVACSLELVACSLLHAAYHLSV